MEYLSKLTENIYRLTIPFFDIYTTVFILKTSEGIVVFDTATYPEDVDNYIIPALREIQQDIDSIAYVVLSHSHRDHAGGLGRLLELFPDTTIVTGSNDIKEKYADYKCMIPEDEQKLTSNLMVLHIPGHAKDCMGLYDESDEILLSGDCLQLYGIFGSGKWGANISEPMKHIQVVEKLKVLSPASIVASHDYHPYGYLAQGEEAVEQYLEACKDALYNIKKQIIQHPNKNDEELAQDYNSTGELPTLGTHVFAAVRKTLV